MVKKLKLITFIAVVFVLSPLMKGQNEPYVAKIGDIKIFEREFSERYELTPLFRRHITSYTPSLKNEFLYTIIAEKLWALEAERLGYDTTAVIELAVSTMEKMFVRDALYKKEILGRVVLEPEEIISAYMKSLTSLQLNYLFSENEIEINNLYNLLEQDISFDTLLSVREEYFEQEEPMIITFGKMPEHIEEVLFTLLPGDFTKPFDTQAGWYIFRLYQREEEIIEETISLKEAREKVEKILTDRKAVQIYNEYFRDFFAKQKIEVDGNIFKSVVSALSNILKDKKNKLVISDNDNIYFDEDDLKLLAEQLDISVLDKSFINYESEPVSSREFLRQLSFTGFSSKFTDVNRLTSALNNKIRTMIEHELLAREGYKQGLQHSPEIKYDLQIWKSNYLYQLIKNEFVDASTITEDDMSDHYQQQYVKARFPSQVNIIEILVDSLSLAGQLLEMIKNGSDIKELSAKHTKREWTKERNGEFGFFPVSMYGEIGNIASTMKIGDVYGPLKVEEGYSIFKLIDKRNELIDTPKPFEQVETDIQRELYYNKVRGTVAEKTAELAIRYGIEINNEILNSIDVTNLNTVMFRLIGFGGVITAVPIIAPNNEWIKNYEEKLKQFP